MTVAGSNVTCYVFDRSAVYESSSFDCAKEPGPLIKALIGYQLMTEEEMGFDATMEKESEAWIIKMAGKRYKSSGHVRRAPGIFSRATAIWPVVEETSGREFVLKDYWPENFGGNLEGTLYEIANGNGVRYMPTLESHGFVDPLQDKFEFLIRKKSLEEAMRWLETQKLAAEFIILCCSNPRLGRICSNNEVSGQLSRICVRFYNVSVW
jgi:hypothetical protein